VPVNITAQPSNAIKCVGESASFFITATGTGITYQWQFNGVNLSDGGTISGATTNNLVISSVASTDAGSYVCKVTGDYDDISSNAAELTVYELISINTHPVGQTLCVDDDLILEVQVTGYNPTYQWTKDGANLANGGNISGADGALLIISDVTDADQGSYRCLVSNTCNSQTSDIASITIDPAVSITTLPTSQTKCEDEPVNFVVAATGNNLTYQWFRNTDSIHNSADVSGANSNSLTINFVSTADEGVYSCVVSDNCTSATSSGATLTIQNNTLISTNPTDTVVCEGENPYFSVEATGSGLSYQWQKDGVDLTNTGLYSGTAENLLLISNADETAEGSYKCVVSGACNSEDSYQVNLTVNVYPDAAGTITGDTEVCQGDNFIQYIVPEINNADSYDWTLPNGASIYSGDGTRSIIVEFDGSAISGVVSVHGVSVCGNGTESPDLAVTINQLPVAEAGMDTVICASSITLDANATANGVWRALETGRAIIANENQYNTNVTSIAQGETNFEWTVTDNGCIAKDTVKITNALITVNAGEDQVLCSDSTTFAAMAPLSGAVWSVVSGAGAIENTSLSNSVVKGLQQDENIFAWVVTNQGCMSSDTVSLFNYLPGVAIAGPDQTIESANTTLDATPPEDGTSGRWSINSGSGIFTDATDPNTEVTNLASGINEFIWTVQRFGCTLEDAVLINNTLLEDPEAGVAQIICDDFTSLEAIEPNVGKGEWSVKSGSAIFEDKYDHETNVTNLAAGENWLVWSVSTSFQTVEYDSVLINNKKPTAANAGVDIITCESSLDLQGNTPNIGTGKWTLNSGSGTVIESTNSNSLYVNIGQGENTLKWVINNDMCYSEDEVIITNNTPTTANAGLDQTICYDSTSLLPNTPTEGSPSWSVISGKGSIDGNFVTNLAPDTNILRYTITKGTCVSEDDVEIINNNPTTPLAGYDINICTDSVTLDANRPEHGSGIWTVRSGSGEFIFNNFEQTLVRDISYGENIYRWTIVKGACKEYDELTVSNNYITSDAGKDITLCSDEFELLASNPEPGV